MSDSLLTLAHSAFDRGDWTTLIQCVREFSTQELTPERQGLVSPAASDSLPNGHSREQIVAQFIDLAVKALVSANFETRWTLVPVIVRFRHRAIAPLLTILEQFDADSIDEEDVDWDLLWFIARILGDIRHPDAVAALIKVLQTSPSEDVVTAAVMALAQQGREAIDPLMQLLNHSATKGLAAQALAQVFVSDPAEELRHTLTAITQDPDADVRATVIDALSHAYHPQVMDCLVEATRDTVAVVRQTAVTGLGLQAKSIDHDTLLAAVEPCLWDLDADVRRQAAIALSRVKTAAAAKHLATALAANDFPPYLKPEVVRALVWTNTAAGLDYIASYLRNHPAKAEIYQEVAVMLGRVEVEALYPQATALLLELLSDHNITRQSAMIRQAIANSLGQLGQSTAQDALKQLSQDSDERVRLHAIAALKNLD